MKMQSDKNHATCSVSVNVELNSGKRSDIVHA